MTGPFLMAPALLVHVRKATVTKVRSRSIGFAVTVPRYSP